eukprot:Rmarinus@m.27621
MVRSVVLKAGFGKVPAFFAGSAASFTAGGYMTMLSARSCMTSLINLEDSTLAEEAREVMREIGANEFLQKHLTLSSDKLHTVPRLTEFPLKPGASDDRSNFPPQGAIRSPTEVAEESSKVVSLYSKETMSPSGRSVSPTDDGKRETNDHVTHDAYEKGATSSHNVATTRLARASEPVADVAGPGADVADATRLRRRRVMAQHTTEETKSTPQSSQELHVQASDEDLFWGAMDDDRSLSDDLSTHGDPFDESSSFSPNPSNSSGTVSSDQSAAPRLRRRSYWSDHEGFSQRQDIGHEASSTGTRRPSNTTPSGFIPDDELHENPRSSRAGESARKAHDEQRVESGGVDRRRGPARRSEVEGAPWEKEHHEHGAATLAPLPSLHTGPTHTPTHTHTHTHEYLVAPRRRKSIDVLGDNTER